MEIGATVPRRRALDFRLGIPGAGAIGDKAAAVLRLYSDGSIV
jgi:hypothetical protein